MAIIRCSKGHFYDDVKFTSCPHCERGYDAISDMDEPVFPVIHSISHEGKTVPGEPDILKGNNEEDGEGKTVSLFVKTGKSNPVSGWLVCIKGENKGRSFELHIGQNFVGRSMKSDLVINDKHVSREKHFAVVYDPRSKSFFISNGVSPVYLNGSLVEKSSAMKEDDIVGVGESEFRFIPFCKEGRDWND